MANDIMGLVSKVWVDKNDNVTPYSISLDGMDKYFNFSQTKYRKKPFEIPKEGQTVKIRYDNKKDDETGKVCYIKRMKIVQNGEPAQQDLSKEVSPPPDKAKDTSVKPYPYLTMDKVGITYGNALKIAGDISGRFKEKLDDNQVYGLEEIKQDIHKNARDITIQAFKDVKELYEHLKEENKEENE